MQCDVKIQQYGAPGSEIICKERKCRKCTWLRRGRSGDSCFYRERDSLMVTTNPSDIRSRGVTLVHQAEAARRLTVSCGPADFIM